MKRHITYQVWVKSKLVNSRWTCVKRHSVKEDAERDALSYRHMYVRIDEIILLK